MQVLLCKFLDSLDLNWSDDYAGNYARYPKLPDRVESFCLQIPCRTSHSICGEKKLYPDYLRNDLI